MELLLCFCFFLGSHRLLVLCGVGMNIVLEMFPYDIRKMVGAICPSKMSSSFPVKCHLPLITTRIEFEFNVLPAPPQITPRRDFGAQIRRQNRRDSVAPYSHSSLFREVTPARSSAFLSLADLSSDDDSEKGFDKIRKPPGEAGRVNSGGYDLQTALGWDFEQYDKFCVSLLVTKLQFIYLVFIDSTEVY